MIMDNQIPDYAFVPAKEPDEAFIVPVGKKGLYRTEQISNIKELFKKNIVIEEDILVPDVKPDLKEILLMDGTGILNSRIADAQNIKEETITVNGIIAVQGLYIAEETASKEPIIPIDTKIPFKEQISLKPEDNGKLEIDLSVEKVEYYVINERKYRVRISALVTGREYVQKGIQLFQGIEGEDLRLRKEKTAFTNVQAWKMESMEIEDTISLDDKGHPIKILKQNIEIIENYKQITQEKIVINGFAVVNVLCMFNKTVDENQETYLRQIQEKIEFTQFIPGSFKGQCHVGNLYFDCSNLKVSLDEIEDEEKICVKGEIVTYIQIHQAVVCEITTDAYHCEKEFICDYELDEGINLIGTSLGEGIVREIISPKMYGEEIRKILYVDGKIQSCNCKGENERISAEGSLLINLVCETENKDETKVVSLKNSIPFRINMEMPILSGNEKIYEKARIRDLKADLVNGKQIEISGSVVLSAEIIEEVRFKIVQNPIFEEKQTRDRFPSMSVYAVQKGDDLWSIAKTFKTSEEAIRKANNLDAEQISPGTKLLIVRE